MNRGLIRGPSYPWPFLSVALLIRGDFLPNSFAAARIH